MLQRNRQGILVTEQRGTKLIQVGLSLPASERVSTLSDQLMNISISSDRLSNGHILQ